MDVYTKTLNKTGFALNNVLDPVVQQFVDFARQASLPVLELGAAYGMSTAQCLNSDVTLMLNDLDERHLQIALERCPQAQKKRLVLLPGDLETLPILSNSLGAVLCCRVIHFFDPAKVRRSLNRVYDWLAPQGKAFFTVESPYLGPCWSGLAEDFMRGRRQGQPFPGHVRVRDYVDDDEMLASLPETMNFFDVDTLSEVFSVSGFQIEFCRFIPRPYFFSGLQLDGRESVGIVAVKP